MKGNRNAHIAERQGQVGSMRKVADEFGVSKSTVHRAMMPKLGAFKPPKQPRVGLKQGFIKLGPAK